MKNNNDLLSNVQRELAKNTTLKSYLSNVSVLMNDGAVVLAGAVESYQLKNLIKTIVNAVPGVKLLIDNLKIETVPQHRVGVQFDWIGGRMVLTR